MHMRVLPEPLSVYHVSAWSSRRPEEGVGSSATGVTDDCEPLCGCLELNLGPSKEEPVLSAAELYLQTPESFPDSQSGPGSLTFTIL